MNIMGLGFALLIVALAVFLGFEYFRYKGTPWERTKKVFLNSVTILWSRFIALLAMVAGVAVNLVNDPSISYYMQSILKPEHMLVYVVLIMVVSEMARRRTADPEGDDDAWNDFEPDQSHSAGDRSDR